MANRIPLEKLISADTNMYELTNAAIHRAGLLGLTRKKAVDSTDEKIASMAITEIVSGDVQYGIRQS